MKIGQLAALGPKSNIGSPRLKGFEIAARRNFPVRVLRGDPDFEIIGFGSGESQVAAAQADDPVGQFERLQNRFGRVGEALELGIRFLRGGEGHEFDLMELVYANQAASVLSV